MPGWVSGLSARLLRDAFRLGSPRRSAWQAPPGTLALSKPYALEHFNAERKIDILLPTTWVDNAAPYLEASNLNKMEQGISDLISVLS